MSFAGEYAAIAGAMPSNDLAVVCEIYLNYPTYDRGDGQLVYALLVSDKAVKARFSSYDPCVIKGGWSGVRQTIELRAAGLSGLSTSVTVADPDNRVRNALINSNNRNSPAQIVRVVPGSDDDYDTRFTGLLDSWEFQTNQVKLNLKTDERNLRANFPAWTYLRSEWFHMDPAFEGKYAPHIYGKHDSDTLELKHGMVPTVPVWRDTTSNWFSTNISFASYIKDVYVSDSSTTVKQAWTAPGAGGNDYEKVYGSLAGGKVFTMIEFLNFPSTDKVVTADVYGYGEPRPSIFNGSEAITNPVVQLRHFLVNYAFNRSRGYISYGLTSPLLDSVSWDAAATFADNHGLEGSRFMDEQKTAMAWLVEWCDSFPMFRPFWNTDGQIEMRTLTAEWPGYWPGSPELIRREDTIGTVFRYNTDPMDVTGKISIQYLRDSVDHKFLRTLDIEDPSTGELQDTSLAMFWAPSRQS